MKNKKGLSQIITTFLVVLLVLVAILIVWAVVNNLIDGEKHFKIYKEECSIEQSYPYYKLKLYVSLGCPHCEKQKSILEENNLEGINTTDCLKETEKCFDEGVLLVPSWKIIGEEEVYTGVKTIEELQNLLNESYEEEICRQVEINLDWENTCLLIGETDCFSPYYDGVDWLDENCLCSELCNKDVCVEKSEIFDMKIKDMECYEYQCRNYTVEVWNQIK